LTKDELIAFERDIAEEFNAGHIRAPVHLDGGNEDALIRVFSEIGRDDWVCCSWRSHYKALLHGVPPFKVKAEIMVGRSIALCFPEHRFFSSAIVGGALPIGLGIAMAIKRAGGTEKVYCFVGDMTARGGMYHECTQYAERQDLPIFFVEEDNGLSVCTDTRAVWGSHADKYVPRHNYFSYTLPWPHSGAGKRVEF
jgi:TPP-dependent pyruvate/acetoin dehydrogenase alpha subunit